ncbi:histidine kinase [Aequorivita sublithincola DSM 14238]|uniref:histidine kinase n=1 Tax=Aequorivita sublithincola (strain DSM 14238 / LMG 21431 / ACAM 643 / 9-3) TaxID=746697 RepID=I3YVB4_AEQSU|nr:sensor histidine kinase [Aequorivita sublithincola]AFL80932.1 histidine kinase [Aequorivita sublithincola DSM 14238]
MKKIVIIHFIIALSPISGYCQDIQHYEDKLAITKNKLEKLTVLDSLLARTYYTDSNAFINYSIQYIALAQEMDSIEYAAKKAIKLQIPLTNYANDPLNAITIINSVLARRYKIKDSSLLGGLYIKRGKANAKVDFKKAIEDYNMALENFSKKDSLKIADAYLFRGQAYSNIGKFVLAGIDYKTAYSKYEAKKEYDYMVFAQQGIISMFSMNGFYEKAKEERAALIMKMKALKLDKFLSNEYYNQALDYKKMGERNLEYKSLLKAEKSYIKNESSLSTFIGIHSRLIEYYCEHNQVIEAKKHLELIAQLDYDLSGNPPAELNFLGGKAKYLQTTGKYEEALELAQKKLSIAQNLGLEDEIMSSHSFLAELYFDLEDYKKSIQSSQASNKVKDSIYNRSTANALAYYQTLYETEKKEKELVEKNTNISLLEKDNAGFKNALLFGGIAILFGFGLVLLYRNQRYLKNHKILQEKFSQKLLISQENERRRISKDLHDGIGQQLLVIKNKLMTSGDNDTKKMVDNTIEEVRAISRDLHPFQLQELGITKAIENTINLIDENTVLFISAEIDNIDNVFSKEDEVNIYRIIQESLSNILKHAQAEAGKVSVKRFTNTIFISIRDNGVGFDFTEKYQDVKSLGLKTLLERTKFLKGQMKVTSKKDSGTVLEFQFPL